MPVGIAAGQVWAAMAHWPAVRLAGVAGSTLAGPVAVLSVRQLDSAAARDGGVCFTMCFMLVVSCAMCTWVKSAIYDCLVVMK